MAVVQTRPITALQFGLMPPELIRRQSVVEVQTPMTYVNGKPVENGLFDPRMGTLEQGTICPTDGLPPALCPGYFGHLELAIPVYYIQYFDTILEILRVVCPRCSKLLLDKEKYKYLLELPNNRRWKRVYSLVGGKIKRCGEQNEGCGCKQPRYVKKGFASINAEWVSKGETTLMEMTPQSVREIFKRINDEDVTFMGFSPVLSRPEWMVCVTLAVPPPAVRPSVKHDPVQRGEDDLTYTLIQIMKTNKALKDKIRTNGSPIAIKEEHMVLQYFVATMVDNNLANAQPAAQRSGRKFKDIMERIKGKAGRVRGNLMGKRVDFSARAVITPDPSLSISDLGIPMKIAQNITKPIKATEANLDFLKGLVFNGPEVYPGAKTVVKNGMHVALRYADRTMHSAALKVGDVVYRHMMDGDIVLFNRQPSLHRMSMMGHRARIMKRGNTFRMNVSVTKPYNADFDGDEMNMHVPQDDEAAVELEFLAAVSEQIVSPATNDVIIGIYQDSLLMAYLFSKERTFSPKEVMGLCVNTKRVPRVGALSSCDLLSQVMPPLTHRAKNKAGEPVIIKAGKYETGQLDKLVLAGGSTGLIHRIFMDFGSRAATDFIDSLQGILAQFMNLSSFSVGISDLVSTAETTDDIRRAIALKTDEVLSLIRGTFGGVVNDTNKSNQALLEDQIMEMMGKANEQVGKIAKMNMAKENRFALMVEAGSKGSMINYTQMGGCLGQQMIDGGRIPYGFTDRTLPCFPKYDDSPVARGFIEKSFIAGLRPHDVFFHAMAGRQGLIDTAVKTSTTGYIQRRLVKGLEDVSVQYDGTVRINSNGKIVQFKYGDDNVDPMRMDMIIFPLTTMTAAQVYDHFNVDEASKAVQARLTELIDVMLEARDTVMENVFRFTDDTKVYTPVHFKFMIDQVRGMISGAPDISPMEMYELFDKYYAQLAAMRTHAPSPLFKLLYYFFLTPAQLRQFTRAGTILLLERVVLRYKQAAVNPGENVGVVAAQSIGEPTTQMTLNTFHHAGVGRTTVSKGIARMEEILTLTPNPKTPSCTVYLHEHASDCESAMEFKRRIEHTRLIDVTAATEIYYDNCTEDSAVVAFHTRFEDMVAECSGERPEINKSPWIIRLELDRESMLNRSMTMNDVHYAIKNYFGPDVDVVYSDYNDANLVFRINLTQEFAKKRIKKSLDDTDCLNKLRKLEDELLGISLSGIPGIEKVVLRKLKTHMKKGADGYAKQEIWVLDTVGSNLETILSLPYIDATRTISTDLKEVFNVLGIEACRSAIEMELTEVLEADGTVINPHHKDLLCDRMTCNATMVAMYRSGINQDPNVGPIAQATFEETPEKFLQAAMHAAVDPMRSISANIMCGQPGYTGTSMFRVLVDTEGLPEVPEEEAAAKHEEKTVDVVNEFRQAMEAPTAPSAYTIPDLF